MMRSNLQSVREGQARCIIAAGSTRLLFIIMHEREERERGESQGPPPLCLDTYAIKHFALSPLPLPIAPRYRLHGMFTLSSLRASSFSSDDLMTVRFPKFLFILGFC